jgi:hypothetical protein
VPPCSLTIFDHTLYSKKDNARDNSGVDDILLHQTWWYLASGISGVESILSFLASRGLSEACLTSFWSVPFFVLVQCGYINCYHLMSTNCCQCWV